MNLPWNSKLVALSRTLSHSLTRSLIHSFTRRQSEPPYGVRSIRVGMEKHIRLIAKMNIILGLEEKER